MARGLSSLISIIITLLITIALSGMAFLFINGLFGVYTSKVITVMNIGGMCTNGSASILVSNIGSGVIELDDVPADFSSSGNLLKESGFESRDITIGWDPPLEAIDVMLLLDRSTSMVGQGTGIDYCEIPCDQLGYAPGEAYCSGETYPYCEDCDGRNPGLSLVRRRDDYYKNHSFPDDINYEGNCPFNEQKIGALNFTGYMNPLTDRIGVVSFSGPQDDYSDGEIVADLESALTFDHANVMGIINGMELGQNTGIAAAIHYARDEFQNNPREAYKDIILLSDGEETYDVVFKNGPPANPVSEATAAAAEGITIYTIGFREGADEDTLRQVAEATGGSYYFAATGEQLEMIYESIAKELAVSIDGSKSLYGNASLRFPSFPGAALISVYFTLEPMDYLASQYARVDGMDEGSFRAYLLLYGSEADAMSNSNYYPIELFQISAPASSDFTRYSYHLGQGDFDDECVGGPCTFGRIEYLWSGDPVSGTVWVDDVFMGAYMPYLDYVDSNVAYLGDVMIIKKGGDGDFYPYVSKSEVSPQSSVIIKDGNCASKRCDYEIVTPSNSATAYVDCP